MTRNLAKIGVLGHQLDVSAGGDVDPDTGRLLSIAELQQALRLARSGRLGLATDSTAPVVVASPTAPHPGPVEREEDLDDNDDPYGWDPDEESPDDQGLARRVDTSVRWRRTRRGSGDADPAPDGRPRGRNSRRGRRRTAIDASSAQRPRSAAARAARTILGLNRGPDPQADPPPGTQELKSDNAQPDIEITASRRRKLRDADDDFQVAAAPRGFAAVFWRWTARILLVVLLTAGVNQLFVKPLQHPAAVTTTAAAIDPAVARQVAARYAADYLSYSPGRAGANLPALTADSVATAGTSTQLFSGAGYVRTDLVQPGEIVTLDATHVVVAVAVRIHLAVPPAQSPAPQVTVSASAAAPAGNAGDPGPIPTGWTDLGERWLSITVPLEATPAGLAVSDSGGVFAGESPTAIAPIVGAEPDTATTGATAEVAPAFFAGYATSNVSYLMPAGAPVTGLRDAVSFVSLANWTVSTAAAGSGSTSGSSLPTTGIGTAAVTWQLADTNLQITQQYQVSLTFNAGRWYTAALGPASTLTDQ